MRSMILKNMPAMEYACVEAFNTLATNVTFSGVQYKILMMTSCVSNEGKSYVSFNLVRTLANMGYRTVLVDADLRKSVLLSRYNAEIQGQQVGLTHYLAGRTQMEEIVYQTNLRNVYVVPTGKEVVNSLPLLTSAGFSDLLQLLRSNFDFVIVDTPPVGLVIDAAMIANSCDACIFVVTSEEISRRVLLEAKEQVEKSGCTVLGTVLNKITLDTHKSRKYYYKSYYSHYSSTDYVETGNTKNGINSSATLNAHEGNVEKVSEPQQPVASQSPFPYGAAQSKGNLHKAKPSLQGTKDALNGDR